MRVCVCSGTAKSIKALRNEKNCEKIYQAMCNN